MSLMIANLHVLTGAFLIHLHPSARFDLGVAAEAKLADLLEEFGEFDAALIRELLQDQGGDVLEVRVYLGVSCP